MKNQITLAALIVPLICCLTSCETIAEPGSSGTPAAITSSYELGIAKGRADGAGGLSRTPGRHEALYSQADRDDFFRGYEAGYNEGMKATAPGASASESYGQPLSAVNGQGSVTILEGNRTVSVCRTASPNIEQTKFINEQQQIVIKSRGNHGPATVELFSTSNGAQQGKVMAYDIKNGKPAWAAGMGE